MGSGIVGLAFAQAGRVHWLDFAARAGFWVGRAGTLVVARADDEMQPLEEFAQQRGGSVELLDRSGVRREASIVDPALLGGALFTEDLRVNTLEAVPALAAYLAEQGVDFVFQTNVTGVEEGVVHTTRGPFLVRETEPGVRFVSVTNGTGMTTGFGLAEHVLDLIGAPVIG